MAAESNGAIEIRPELQAKLESLPTKPGVYIYRNEKKKVIYVGKSVTLRQRVRSYFTASAQQHPKTHELVAHIHDLDFIVTDSELEAQNRRLERVHEFFRSTLDQMDDTMSRGGDLAEMQAYLKQARQQFDRLEQN